MTTFAGVQEFIFNAVSKSAIGLLLFSGALLFSPQSFLSFISVDSLSNQYKSQVGILFLLSLSTVLGELFKTIYKYVQARWKINEQKAQKLRKKKEYLELVKSRLKSLSISEKKWIQYCLHHNQQTLIARAADSTGNSLANKLLIASAEGSPMAMPFTFTDEVWQYLVDHKDDYLPKLDDRNRKDFEAEMRGFRSSQGML